MLPMIPDDVHMQEGQFAEIASKCDPTVARLGEIFLTSGFDSYFDEEMLCLLQDARKTWVYVSPRQIPPDSFGSLTWCADASS